MSSKQSTPKEAVHVSRGGIEITGNLLERAQQMRMALEQLAQEAAKAKWSGGNTQVVVDPMQWVTALVIQQAEAIEKLFELTETVKVLQRIILENSEEAPPDLKLVTDDDCPPQEDHPTDVLAAG